MSRRRCANAHSLSIPPKHTVARTVFSKQGREQSCPSKGTDTTVCAALHGLEAPATQGR
ncbi:MAG: hypothetical protein NZ874_00110 [Fimbriimonadales bacterium]|nr:hypothetical protein [Fimbriimonadales bacterium]